MDLPVFKPTVSELPTDEVFSPTEPTLLTTDNLPVFIEKLQAGMWGENGARYARIGNEVYVGGVDHVEILRKILPLAINEGLDARSVANLVNEYIESLGFPLLLDSFDAGFITMGDLPGFNLKPSNFLKDVLTPNSVQDTSIILILLKHSFQLTQTRL